MLTVPLTGVDVPGGGLELQVIKLKAVTGSSNKKNNRNAILNYGFVQKLPGGLVTK